MLAYDKVEEKILTETPSEEIVKVKISELRSNPYQPRKVFDETALQELASSIKELVFFNQLLLKEVLKDMKLLLENVVSKQQQ